MAKLAVALREKSPQELREELAERKREQFNLRFQKATGQLENSQAIRENRRQIARIKTIALQRARELDAKRKSDLSKRAESVVAKSGRREHTGPLRTGQSAGKEDLAAQPSGKVHPVISAKEANRLVRDLRADTATNRIVAMKKLRDQDISPTVAAHTVARLIPQLVSDNREEALEAAITICKLTFPSHYSSEQGRNAMLQKVRQDLPAIIWDRHIDFVTHVNAEKVSGDTVRLDARISNRMPLPLTDLFARLNTPAWIENNASEFNVVVSGPSVDADSITQSDAALKDGDIGAVTVEYKVVDGDYSDLMVDFFIDNRRLKREKINVSGR